MIPVVLTTSCGLVGVLVGVSAALTVTVYVADLLPSAAVIVAVPAAFAVTTPSATVATFLLLDFHATVPSRFVLTVSLSVPPTVRVPDVLEREERSGRSGDYQLHCHLGEEDSSQALRKGKPGRGLGRCSGLWRGGQDCLWRLEGARPCGGGQRG